jgi:hypothetical protein
MCGSSCTDVSVDIGNCGRCNNRCDPGQLCTAGSCVTPCAPPGLVCNGACVDATRDLANCGRCNNRCAAGQVCSAGACVTPTVTGMAGGACVRDSDCGAGGACLATGSGFTGGYCIYGCPAGATAGDACAGGTGICLNAGGAQLTCFRDCTPGGAGECRSGYICLDVSTDGSIGICYPHCSVNPGAVCGAQRCDASTGECSGLCTAASQCSSGSTCNATSMTCQCTASTNCGTGFRCYPATATRGAACGCTSSAVCSAGRSCDTSTGTCI